MGVATKRIWIVNYYTGTPLTVANPRYIELASYFMDAGYDVLTINADYDGTYVAGDTGNSWCVRKLYGRHQFIHVKAMHYQGNGIRRMLSIFSFAWKLLVHCRQLPAPDAIIHNLHTPFDYPVMWVARKLKARYIAEAWDLWPEDFVTFGLVGEKNPAMSLFYALERRLYRKADAVVFTFEGGADYIKKKGWSTDTGGKVDLSKVHYINNGVNLKKFDADRDEFRRFDPDLNSEELFKIVYLGSIRLVNNVKTLIDAAAILQADPRYRFLIYGDGSDREYLEEYVRENGIGNVVFKEKNVPLKEVAYIVSQATVNVMNYQKDFGIHGVSSGKMFQYMAAGRPICCNIKLSYSEISRNRLGIDDNLDTPQQYASAIRTLVEQPADEYAKMCGRVRECAEKFDFSVLGAKELAVIENLA